MTNKLFRTLKITCLCMALTAALPIVSFADEQTAVNENKKVVTIIHLDENGNPLKNSDGEFVDEEGVSIFEGEAWNFDEDKLPEEDNYKLYLVARWVMNFKLTVDVGQEARDAGLKNVESSGLRGHPSAGTDPRRSPPR